jgi:hypothetical protein
MSNSSPNATRRRFLQLAAISAASAPLLGILAQRTAYADDLPHLAESDATAVALGYIEDASKVDASKYPTYKVGLNCAGCQFYQGKAGEAFAPCQLFPGKAVSSKGWCSGFNAKKA